MRAVKAFLLGAVAVGVVGYAMVAALVVVSQAGGRTLDLSLGPLLLASVVREGQTTVTTFGPGLVAAAIVGGLANLGAAQLIRNRSQRSGDRVD